MAEEQLEWLAQRIFTTFPGVVAGIKCYTLDCGCVYLERILLDGKRDTLFGVYRAGSTGRCQKCTIPSEGWKQRVRNELFIFQVPLEVTGK